MKYIVILAISILSAHANAQDVVEWKATATKVADKTYEVKITGMVQEPWHVYSSTTPEGGPLPTSIAFTKNPLVNLTGKLQEKGKIKEKYEEVFEINVKYFERNAEFVQRIKLRNNAKTSLSGTVEFMACTDKECLPPQTEKFTVKLD